MKSVSIMMLASAGLALAHPSQDNLHNHKRFHALKARQATETTVISTVSVYELNGRVISYDELEEGLRNGTLVLDGDAPAPSPQVQAVSTSTPAPPVVIKEPASSPPPPPPASTQAPPPSSAVSSAQTPAAAPSKAPLQNKQSSSGPASYSGGSGAGSGGYGSSSGAGLTKDYDNSLSCNEFPSAFGAIPVNYLGNNGWLGIMTPGAGSSSAGLDNLSEGNSCTEGAYCSYLCPAGWEKTQWPSTQGATGQSVGGLLCQNGKLTLTRPSVPQLCSNSMQKAQISVQNKLSKQVSVCRTDYPGTENMNIPLQLAAGASSDIACPDAATAYKWKGQSTSAQYYVNPAGVGVEQACQWGNPSQPYGNWAPINLGVGYSNGMAWISIFPNFPTQQSVTLDFKISIVGDINGQCVYQNGQYNGQTGQGCTVSVPTGGKATFVFEDA